MQNADTDGRIASLAEQVSVLTAMLGSVIGHLGNGSACFGADPLCALCIDDQTCSLCREVSCSAFLFYSLLLTYQDKTHATGLCMIGLLACFT